MPFKRPESVLVVLYDEHHRLLVLQRDDDPDFWQSVTGTVEHGEMPEETALREVAEETGIVLFPQQLKTVIKSTAILSVNDGSIVIRQVPNTTQSMCLLPRFPLRRTSFLPNI